MQIQIINGTLAALPMMHNSVLTASSRVQEPQQKTVCIFYQFIYDPVLILSYIVIIEALLLGEKDGNDILTLSLGGANGWTESSLAVVASRIAGKGKVVTIAAGNDVG